MARIPLPDDSAIGALPPQLRDAAQHGALINVFRVLLRSPQIATPVIQLGAAQFASSSLGDIDRELAILAAGACFDAPYEAAQHEQISQAVGVSEAQRIATSAKEWHADCFTLEQQSLLEFVAAVAAHPTVPAAIFDSAQNHFTDQQLVEVVVQTGYYFLIARVSTVLDVPLDPPGDDSVLRAGRSLH